MEHKMKTIKAIAYAGSIGFLLNGCSGTKIQHVNAEDFLRYAAPMDGMYSAESATFIGSSQDKVYIEHKNYITFLRKVPVTTIYWTETDALPGEISEKIRTLQPPWVPFACKERKETTPQLTAIISNGSTQQVIRVVPIHFDSQEPYIGDDPEMTQRLKQRADEQLRLIAPDLVKPEG